MVTKKKINKLDPRSVVRKGEVASKRNVLDPRSVARKSELAMYKKSKKRK